MDFQIDPHETALLIIDMQNAFCHPEGTLGISGVEMSGLTSVVEPTKRLIEACKAAGIPDIWTIQHHLPADQTRALHKIVPHTQKRARVACQPGTWDAEIVDQLKPLIDQRSHLIEKHKFSAFYGTRLEVLLRILGRRMLLISGTTANACIDTTIREAYMRDYDVLPIRECIGGINREWSDVAFAVWGRYMGRVISLDDVLAQMPSAISSVVADEREAHAQA